jgi:hypothetical protein
MAFRVIPAVLFVCSITVSAQQETLLDIARRSAPNPVYQSRSTELVMVSVDTAISGAGRIVHGVVERSTTYLSTDKKNLYTDYVVRPLRVMKPVQSTPVTSRPGLSQVPRITVTRWGGEMVLEGVKVTQEDHDTRHFQVGEELILLLSPRGTDKFALSAPTSSVFTVNQGRVQPFTLADHEAYNRVRGITVSQFDEEVRRHSR